MVYTFTYITSSTNYQNSTCENIAQYNSIYYVLHENNRNTLCH